MEKETEEFALGIAIRKTLGVVHVSPDAKSALD